MRLKTRFAPLVLILVCTSLAAAEPVPSEQLLPEKTLAFAKIPSAAEFRQKWKDSSFGTIQNDPAFREFIADIERQISGLTVGVEKSVGVGLKDLWLALEGEVSVALVHRPNDGFAFVAIADIGKNDEAAARFISQVNARLAASGGVDATIKSGNLDVTSWSVGAGAETRKFSYFRDGQRLVVSNNLNALLETAGRRTRAGGAKFSDNVAYQQIVKQTQPGSGWPAAQWYVNALGLLEAGVTDNLRGNPNRELLTGLLPQAGLDKFKAIGGSLELAAPGVDSITRTASYIETPAGGLLEAFKLPATRQVPPNWVQDDVNLYGQINFSVPQVYHTIATFFNKAQGDGSFEAIVGSTKIGNSDYTYQDLAEQLVGPVHIVAQIPTSTQDLTMQPSVIAFGVKDPATMNEMMNALAKSAEIEPQTVEGVSVYSASLPSPIEGQQFHFGAAVAENALMFSTNADYLKSVLADRTTKRPLAESQAYQKAVAQFPQKTAMISYQRQDQRFEGLYEQIRTGKLQLPLYGGIASGLGLDFSKLPPFTAMSRYLQTSSSYIEPTENGFRMVSIGQPPREQ